MTISTMSLQDSSRRVNSHCSIYDAPWRHLDRCSCSAFVSPKSGVCNNKRCQHHGQQVADPKPWPPSGIVFTNKPELIGTPVAAGPEQEAASVHLAESEATPPEPELEPEATQDQQPAIDWARIEDLESRIRSAAISVAQSTGGDADDLFANARLAIIERGLEEPQFLAQTDAYIVNYGIWRARDQLRHENLRPTVSIDGDDEGAPPLVSPIVDDADLHIALAALPETQRDLVQLIFSHGELIRSGRVNVKALARELGISWRQANNQLQLLRQSLARQGLSAQVNYP